MKITSTHGNSSNKIKGTRIRLTSCDKKLVINMFIPSLWGLWHCNNKPNSKHGKIFANHVKTMEEYEKNLNFS